jgi:hypothetical protein
MAAERVLQRERLEHPGVVVLGKPKSVSCGSAHEHLTTLLQPLGGFQ